MQWRQITMIFLLHQIGQLVMVPIIMICALFGTIGIIKLIQKFFPFIDISQHSFDKGKNDEQNHTDKAGKNR